MRLERDGGTLIYAAGEFPAEGGFSSKVCDVQSRLSSTVTYTQCQYGEVYRTSRGICGEVLAFPARSEAALDVTG
ncbi:MAG: zinc ribbon domain-containing protein [Planctomycetota bacterium]